MAVDSSVDCGRIRRINSLAEKKNSGTASPATTPSIQSM